MTIYFFAGTFHRITFPPTLRRNTFTYITTRAYFGKSFLASHPHLHFYSIYAIMSYNNSNYPSRSYGDGAQNSSSTQQRQSHNSPYSNQRGHYSRGRGRSNYSQSHTSSSSSSPAQSNPSQPYQKRRRGFQSYSSNRNASSEDHQDDFDGELNRQVANSSYSAPVHPSAQSFTASPHTFESNPNSSSAPSSTKRHPQRGPPVDDVEAGVLRLWNIYASNPAEPPSDGVILIIRALTNSYGTVYSSTGKLLCYELFDPRRVGLLGAANLDYPAMLRHSPIEDLDDALRRTPESVLCCFALSIHIFLMRRNVAITGNRIYVHVLKYGPLTPVRLVKSSLESKLVTVKGTVTRVGSVRPLVKAMEFSCDQCSATQQAFFQNAEFDPPRACLGKCRGRFFTPIVSRATAVDWQLFRLQVRMLMAHMHICQ